MLEGGHYSSHYYDVNEHNNHVTISSEVTDALAQPFSWPYLTPDSTYYNYC